ncbi:hypothetical protein AMS68_006228 [Peltaster fructicola]|uniref:Altered inheritance of mitochondria protein 41 n=1 Tax=Peltaster fructicola TaxID=286661 RepID=A0A6H0Y1B4_9PEZI|nr:hypothetical protein AMS68_006228 [Peltaster fructicola]
MFTVPRHLAIRRAKLASSRWVCASCQRAYSDAPSAPPLLLKLRNDLKTAMKTKDTQRLNVLKSLLADITNAGKTNNPIQTDMQLLSLLQKRSTAARTAGEEFKAAGRADLLAQEETQASILDEYAGGVETMSVADITEAVKTLVLELRSSEPGVRAGEVMKALFKEGGALASKPVDRKLVPGIVKQVLGAA